MSENILKEVRPGLSAADTLKTAADALDAAAIEQAQRMAAADALPLMACYERLLGEFIRRAKERIPGYIIEADGRTAKWRVRVRLYTAEQPDDPQADSDPDLAPDQPGETVLAGLPAVAQHLAALATAYHTSPCIGLDEATLKHRLKSLRPTLSRRGGNARWRVPYTAAAGPHVAVVDVQREESA